MRCIFICLQSKTAKPRKELCCTYGNKTPVLAPNHNNSKSVQLWCFYD
eukprot:UN18247